MKVEKDLNVIRKIYDWHNEYQQKGKRRMLAKGVTFFQLLCIFDPNVMKKALDDEIVNVERRLHNQRQGSRSG